MKKKSSKKSRLKKRESRQSLFYEKLFLKSFPLLALMIFPILLLNIAFGLSYSVPIRIYFLIVYIITFIFAVVISSMLLRNLYIFKSWDKRDLNGSFKNWLFRIIFIIFLSLDLIYYLIPMTGDLPRIITGRYKESIGTVESVETNDYLLKNRGPKSWEEKKQYVYFRDQASGKTSKFTFHANNPYVHYYHTKIYYLPFTKWGIRAE